MDSNEIFVSRGLSLPQIGSMKSIKLLKDQNSGGGSPTSGVHHHMVMNRQKRKTEVKKVGKGEMLGIVGVGKNNKNQSMEMYGIGEREDGSDSSSEMENRDISMISDQQSLLVNLTNHNINALQGPIPQHKKILHQS
jgi:hypothetical protein